MHFSGFRIRNFRSIVDTGWNNLASDNITGIIGQNESGKTSILEALYSFYTGVISDDILRSDLSLPVVYCTFEIDVKQLKKMLGQKKIPDIVIKSVEESGMITIIRRWTDNRSQYISFGDDRVSAYFENQLNEKKKFEEAIEKEVMNIIEESKKATEELNEAIQEKKEEQKLLSQLEYRLPKIQKAFDRSPGKENKSQLEKINIELEQSKKHFEKKSKACDSKSARASDLAEKARRAQWCLETINEFENISKEYKSSLNELTTLKKQYEGFLMPKGKRQLQKKIDIVHNHHIINQTAWEKARKNVSTRKAVTAKILKGIDPEEAEELVDKENARMAEYYTDIEMAEECFKHIPVFEMFEDFSSLLPNRIDMEDVFAENSMVEGFKAARNFLIIAGLDEKFFEVQNNRILKQKIEKLNNEITLNFQDYWRQSIGKQDKIKINFELEHYDYRYPEKMGKPYLEFWIKDAQERLYPKQRSRGVRWFLSFYLELKASAIEYKDRSRVFLIDEPGLSLHARAQEDVLKVFEDIKEDIQIIYTTHSPHLINLSKLYRLLAVQRAVEDDMKSETVIFDAKSLNEASTDTLSPIYTLMGTKLSDHQFIKKKNNVIVEDTVTYHYLKTLFSLIDFSKEIYFLPATDVLNVPALVNLLIGWRLDFIVLLDDDVDGNLVYNDLKINLFHNNEKRAAGKMIKLHNVNSIEDIFSTIDFKNFVLHKRVGITESNSEYIENNNLSRTKLMSSFVLHVQNNNVRFDDFDEETQENIATLVQKLDRILD
jgi:energy-coupling factor transporter ATP-binding protein EcfA2